MVVRVYVLSVLVVSEGCLLTALGDSISSTSSSSQEEGKNRSAVGRVFC